MGDLIPKDFFELRASNAKYWALLKEQVEKDFQRIGSIVLELDSSNHDNWIETIRKACERLDNSNQLDNFLYIVDLPENWSNDLKLSSHYYTDLAYAILRREWVEIYYRLNY